MPVFLWGGEQGVPDQVPSAPSLPPCPLAGAIRKQLAAFLEGFYEIIPKRLISIFTEQELELLISGLPTIDIDDLKANTEYHKYQANSIQVCSPQLSPAVLPELAASRYHYILHPKVGCISPLLVQCFTQPVPSYPGLKLTISRPSLGNMILSCPVPDLATLWLSFCDVTPDCSQLTYLRSGCISHFSALLF